MVQGVGRAGTAPLLLTGSRRRTTARARRDWGAAYVLLAPAVALLGVWFVYPIVDTVVLSFQQVNLFHFSERTYVGLTNFHQLWTDPAFHHSLFITAIFVLLVVPAQTVLALAFASVLQSVGAGKAFFRTAVFLPYMTSTVAVTTVFMKLFVEGGPLASSISRALRRGGHDVVRRAQLRPPVPRHRVRLYVHRSLRHRVRRGHRERAGRITRGGEG